MRAARYATVVSLSILVTIVVLIFISSLAPSFHECIKASKHGDEYKAIYEHQAGIGGIVARTRLDVVCSGYVADQNHDVINMFATVCVALFTLALWVSTHRLWKAGEKQIKVARESADIAMLAIGSERAWMSINDSPRVRIYTRGPQEAPIPYAITFQFMWTNLGRSPATQVRCFTNSRLIDYLEGFDDPPNLPLFAPVWTNSVQFTTGPGGHVLGLERGVTEQEFESFVRKGKSFILYTYISYRDVFNPQVERTAQQCVLVNNVTDVVDKDLSKAVFNWEYRPIGAQNTTS